MFAVPSVLSLVLHAYFLSVVYEENAFRAIGELFVVIPSDNRTKAGSHDTFIELPSSSQLTTNNSSSLSFIVHNTSAVAIGPHHCM